MTGSSNDRDPLRAWSTPRATRLTWSICPDLAESHGARAWSNEVEPAIFVEVGEHWRSPRARHTARAGYELADAVAKQYVNLVPARRAGHRVQMVVTVAFGERDRARLEIEA